MTPHKLGRYEITDVLGQGAMGVVYRAIDPIIDRVVAIKTINMALKEDEIAEYEARFYQEAKAGGGLNHPNIVTVYDIGKSGSIAYMAMEFLEGKELRALLAPGVALPLAQAVDLAAQVAEGLAYAHQNHVVHRDIKPANIMIVRNGVAKITDFGIARMRCSKTFTHTGMVLGSPKYMAPEQVLGKRTDPRSDLFALGVVLYEMLTGHAPFTGSDVNALMFQILNLVPPLASMLNPAVPEMLDLIAAKSLAKAPEDRYQDAAEFAADLRECGKRVANETTARRILAASAGALAARVDSESSAALLADAESETRRGSGEREVDEPSPTLGLANGFDSFEATLRLAARTGMTQELNDYALTRSLQGAPETTVHADAPLGTATVPSRQITRAASVRWSVRDRMVFAAGIVISLVVAALILLL